MVRFIIIVAVVAVLVILCCLAMSFLTFSGMAEPSKERARKQAEQFIGFEFGDGVEISHWYCETIPDLIISCSFSLPSEKHQELIEYCKNKGLTPKICEQESFVPKDAGDCYCFETSHHGKPEEFHIEKALISQKTNNIYYYRADGA